MPQTATYTCASGVHTFDIGVPGLETLTVDQSAVPAEERNGLAKQLLSSAALSCYAAMLAGALEARGAKFSRISGKASLSLGPNEAGQGRVKKMLLEFEVDLPEADAPIFERCLKIMRNGCLLTGSLHEGMAVDYDLKANFEK